MPVWFRPLAIFVAASALIVVGVGMIYLPAALIVAGGLLLAEVLL